MADAFDGSGALQRLRLLESAYQVGVAVSTSEDLSVPPATGREVTFATAFPTPEALTPEAPTPKGRR